MDKYKINYIFNSEKDINDILINVLKKEIKKYTKTKNVKKIKKKIKRRYFLYQVQEGILMNYYN